MGFKTLSLLLWSQRAIRALEMLHFRQAQVSDCFKCVNRGRLTDVLMLVIGPGVHGMAPETVTDCRCSVVTPHPMFSFTVRLEQLQEKNVKENNSLGECVSAPANVASAAPPALTPACPLSLSLSVSSAALCLTQPSASALDLFARDVGAVRPRPAVGGAVPFRGHGLEASCPS